MQPSAFRRRCRFCRWGSRTKAGAGARGSWLTSRGRGLGVDLLLYRPISGCRRICDVPENQEIRKFGRRRQSAVGRFTTSRSLVFRCHLWPFRGSFAQKRGPKFRGQGGAAAAGVPASTCFQTGRSWTDRRICDIPRISGNFGESGNSDFGVLHLSGKSQSRRWAQKRPIPGPISP